MTQTNDLREKLAALCHEQWSGWMRYLFSKCEKSLILRGAFVITPELAQRWHHQLETPYAELSEGEKDSDRKEADKFLALLDPSTIVLDSDVSHVVFEHSVYCEWNNAIVGYDGESLRCPLCGDWLQDEEPQPEPTPEMTREEREEQQRWEHGDQRCDEMRGT